MKGGRGVGVMHTVLELLVLRGEGLEFLLDFRADLQLLLGLVHLFGGVVWSLGCWRVALDELPKGLGV